jgi:signal peptidase I
MYPTLLAGDRFFVNKFIYRFQNPTRGDVIVFKFPLDEQRDFTKRVIAVGGETLSIRDHRIYINCRPPDLGCQPIADPWGYYEDRLGISTEDFGPVHVPQGSYFVMGDHRNNSQDSRTWGFVKAEAIKGRVALIYWSVVGWPGGRDAVLEAGAMGSVGSKGTIGDPAVDRHWVTELGGRVAGPTHSGRLAWAKRIRSWKAGASMSAGHSTT